MFEKVAEEIAKDIYIHHFDDDVNYPDVLKAITVGVQKGAEHGYNKGKEDVKYDLMMKLKEEGTVKPLKDSILRNERLSSQEQRNNLSLCTGKSFIPTLSRKILLMVGCLHFVSGIHANTWHIRILPRIILATMRRNLRKEVG